MIFKYQAIDQAGEKKEGEIDAVNVDIAISSLQRRGYVISKIDSAEKSASLLNKKFTFFRGVKNKDIVILSRQIATLFGAQVSALRVFRLLANETPNMTLQKTLTAVADHLQDGSSISKAMSDFPDVFSAFYVNMVRSGEESGKLDEIFNYLADYLDRTYEVSSKARNALIYPAFVVVVFITVMVLMFTMVIPKISGILTDSGQAIPLYTQIILSISNFFVSYGIFLLVTAIIAGFILFRYSRTEKGKETMSHFKLSVPYIGTLYSRLYLSRFCDNMHTMLVSGIPMIRALEITSSVIDNMVFTKIMANTVEAVKSGSSLSDALAPYPEVPGIVIQMVKVGEETGQLGQILKTMSDFYRREVSNAVDTLVSLIEPAMIVALGLGVGILLAAVLIPIYNISSAM